ncbi:MAG: hypothetical protein CMJ31_04410 [Phycisphaerae bacterium]|nr:hypothetical protein [Phycisphaerae bacterium]
MGRALTIAITAAALGVAAAPMAGCRGERTEKPPRRFFPDMDDQQRWDPQEKTEFFVDHRTTRPAPANTVAFGSASMDPEAVEGEAWAEWFVNQRTDFLASDDAVYRGQSGEGEWIDRIPVPVTRELIEGGQKNFGIYCATCHGLQGDGKGMVAARWSYPVPSIVGGIYADRSNAKGIDGYLWHVAREGVWDPATGANKMPSYKHVLSEREAWGVVAYLRALQRAGAAGEGDLTQQERDTLVARVGGEASAVASVGDDNAEGSR